MDLRTIFNSISDSKPGKWFNNKYQPAQKNTIVFKIEQTKIQEYFRQKNKDTILALDFICRIDDLVRTNNWSETVTFSNVANTLRGFAPKWLFSIVDMLDYMADQLTWINIKPRFPIQFALQTDNKVMHLSHFIWGGDQGIEM
jgi:hypothetical protein